MADTADTADTGDFETWDFRKKNPQTRGFAEKNQSPRKFLEGPVSRVAVSEKKSHPGIFSPAKKRMTEVCPHVVNPHRLVEIHREPSCRGTCLIVVDQINQKTYVSQRPQEMLKRLSEQADPNDPQARVSFGGFKKAIHKPVLYKGRYQIRLHSLSDSITVLKNSERNVEVIGAPEYYKTR